MLQGIAIASGGALGALMRFWLSGWTYQVFGRAFPYGTLMVNVLGSLLMGFLFVWLTERAALPAEWRALILVGFLGSLTTFSTFSMETMSLIQGGEAGKALLNVVLSVVICLAATWLGIITGRQL
ncbi:MAG: fluoride efflux transporter CrcB [Gammaproteobacteria bacterium]|nr:fluoride efflux transporter CrcB [Gammaproteobacteria bacterium]